MGSGERYSGISISRLLDSRVVLSRAAGSGGDSAWVAESGGRRATGSSRIEALDRVRMMGKERRSDGRVRRRIPPPAADADGVAQGPPPALSRSPVGE